MTKQEKRERNERLQERLILFASNVIDITESLPASAIGRHFADQASRSGSAPARQYAEAQGAESGPDFVHKIKVGLKELRETFVTLRIISLRNWVNDEKMVPLLQENNELISIFISIILSALGPDDEEST
ncbi:MAG: four helix bundle protein [Chitinophagaceae bacterium]|nr:MAG: four helix bundle protein [Chitinophagaceae bacterium]